MNHTQQTNLEERYGRSRQRGIDRRIGWSVAVGALLLGVAFLLFSGWQNSNRVSYNVVHYEVVEATTVRVDFEVTAPAESTVACALEALSESRATVGWRIIEWSTGDQLTRRFNESLTTTYAATTGNVRSCWLLEE